jgi:hypothetical protein
MTTLTQYKVFCNDESTFVLTDFKKGDTLPTLCPNNNTHTINSVLTTIVEQYDEKKSVMTDIDPAEPYSDFRIQNWKWDIPSGATGDVTYHSLNLDYDISAFLVRIKPRNVNVEDEFSVRVDTNITIGALTSDAGPTGATLNISPPAVNYLKVGYSLKLRDGATGPTEVTSMIDNIDIANNTVTLKQPVTGSFPAGSLVEIVSYSVINEDISGPLPIAYGMGKIGGSIFKKSYDIWFEYTNNSGSAKKWSVNVEYLF